HSPSNPRGCRRSLNSKLTDTSAFQAEDTESRCLQDSTDGLILIFFKLRFLFNRVVGDKTKQARNHSQGNGWLGKLAIDSGYDATALDNNAERLAEYDDKS